MNPNLVLMAHVLFGVTCLLGALWVFVDTLNVTEGNLARIRLASVVSAAAMWIAYLFAGYWYVVFYPADKGIILKGPWPLAHNLVMETKEHLVIILLLCATFLPISCRDRIASNRAARAVVLWTSGIVFFLALITDGLGALISMGAKLGLLGR